jgi:hypothetical protein
MSLKEKLIVLGMASTLALSQGCGEFRQGREKVSYFTPVIVPVVVARQETFKFEDSNEIESEKRMSASVSIFGAQIDIEHYGERRKFLGMTKTSITRQGDEVVTRTELYDQNRKLITTTDDMPPSYIEFSGSSEFVLPNP